MATQAEVFEKLLDLVCDVLERAPTESIRRAAQDLRVLDHGRRLEAKGLHPVTGETPDEYTERAKKFGGIHPVTGEDVNLVASTSASTSGKKPAQTAA